MRYLLGATAFVVLLALFAIQPTTVHAAPAEGDWKGGWNTWATAAEGDWAVYAMEGGITVRWEVKKVDGTKVTYTRTTFSKGTQSGQRELTRDWNKIKLQAAMPYGKQIVVEWEDEDMKLGEAVLSCQSAAWTIEKTSQKVYYCKDVPCGGVVKTMTDGKNIVWLTTYGKAGQAEVTTDEPEAAAKTKMPRFYASVNNYVVIKISPPQRDPSYQLRRITDVGELASKYSIVGCEVDGIPKANEAPRELEQTKEEWDKVYAKPVETGVKLKIGEVELTCDVFKETTGDREVTEWVSEGLSVKKVIKTKAGETVMEVVSYHMD